MRTTTDPKNIQRPNKPLDRNSRNEEHNGHPSRQRQRNNRNQKNDARLHRPQERNSRDPKNEVAGASASWAHLPTGGVGQELGAPANGRVGQSGASASRAHQQTGASAITEATASRARQPHMRPTRLQPERTKIAPQGKGRQGTSIKIQGASEPPSATDAQEKAAQPAPCRIAPPELAGTYPTSSSPRIPVVQAELSGSACPRHTTSITQTTRPKHTIRIPKNRKPQAHDPQAPGTQPTSPGPKARCPAPAQAPTSPSPRAPRRQGRGRRRRRPSRPRAASWPSGS